MPKGKTNNPHGRPKGAKNKQTKELRGELLHVFDKLGGSAGLVKWAKESKSNLKTFYKDILPRILPREQQQAGSGLVQVNLVMPHAPLEADLAGSAVEQDAEAVARALESARQLPDDSARWSEIEPEDPETGAIPTVASDTEGQNGA